jgi:hypothetical protein
MLKILIAMYIGGWGASAAPFYAAAKAAHPNEPIKNALRAFGLSATWIVSIIPIIITFVKDLIERFKPTST